MKTVLEPLFHGTFLGPLHFHSGVDGPAAHSNLRIFHCIQQTWKIGRLEFWTSSSEQYNMIGIIIQHDWYHHPTWLVSSSNMWYHPTSFMVLSDVVSLNPVVNDHHPYLNDFKGYNWGVYTIFKHTNMIHCDFLLTFITNIMIICWRLGLPNQTLRKWSEKNTVNHVDPRETIINFQFWGQGWFIVGRIDASGLAVVSSSFLRRSAMLKWKWLQCHEHVGRILRQKSRWRFPKMLPPLMKKKQPMNFSSHLITISNSLDTLKDLWNKWVTKHESPMDLCGSGSKYTTDPLDVPSISPRNHWHPLWCHSRSSKRSVPIRPGDNGIDNSHPHRWPTCCKRQIGRSSFPQTCATKRDEES